LFIKNDAKQVTVILTPTRHGRSNSSSVYSVNILRIEGTDRPHRVYATPLRPL